MLPVRCRSSDRTAHGLVNFMDGVSLWPDQHGGVRLDRGVAILSQSGNMAITLTMQRRGLPVAMLVTLGNRACLGAAAVIDALLDDHRITAIGLLLETLDDAPELAAVMARARQRCIPVVALKLGRSAVGAQLTISHTGSLAGADEAASLFLGRHGIARVASLPALLESLKILHAGGPLGGRTVASLSCSGGEAALMADALAQRRLTARPLAAAEGRMLQATLDDRVMVSNPLDYHTFSWGDVERMTATFAAMMRCAFDIVILMIDLPREDRCNSLDWRRTIDAFARAERLTGARCAVLTTLPDCLDEALACELTSLGLLALAGLEDGLAAVEAAADIDAAWRMPLPTLAGTGRRPAGSDQLLGEWVAKQALASHGVTVPAGSCVTSVQAAENAARRLGLPVAVKAVGLAHKSEHQAVRLGLATLVEVRAAARALLPGGGGLLVERMVEDGVGEVIVGVNRDAQIGLVLLLGSGGTLAEVLQDRVLLLLTASRGEIEAALAGLRVSELLDGFRGRPAGDRAALIDTVVAIQRYALDHADALVELDANPVIVRRQGDGAVVVDALIRMVGEEMT